MTTTTQLTTTSTAVSTALSSDNASTDMQAKIQALKNRVAANTTSSSQSTLELAKVGESAIPLMLFSPEHEDVKIHWIDTAEKKGYVQCNGDDCALCHADNKAYSRLLLQVFNFGSQQVEVLAITDACNPGAALPQILPIFDAPDPMMLLMSRQRNKYTIDLKPVPQNIDLGKEKIEAFNTAYSTGQSKLSDVYEKCSNQELAAIPSIKVMLECRGYKAA